MLTEGFPRLLLARADLVPDKDPSSKTLNEREHANTPETKGGVHAGIPAGWFDWKCSATHVWKLEPAKPTAGAYRGASPIRNTSLLGSFSMTLPRGLWWS